jgi:hypothetical protein
MNAKFPIVLAAVFAAIAAGLYAFCRSHPAFDLTALLISDLVMLCLSLLAWRMMRQSASARPHAFVRGVQGASMLKLFVCLTGVLVYALAKRPDVHKPTLFTMFGIYAVYSIIETAVLSRTVKKVQ